jgi:nicotinamide-nucleotide amidase
MKVSIIAIGDELLVGQVVDTNSGTIARTIAPEGWHVAGVKVVADNREDIIRAINCAFEQAPVVLTTGGLGPTKDDITKGVLMEIFGGELVENAEVLENVRNIMNRRGLQMNALTAAQAMVPSSCTVIQNRLGTAPLMWFESAGKVLVAMPGVPFETSAMFESVVFPRLCKLYPSDITIYHNSFITTGISESALAERLATWEEQLPEGLHLAYLPNAGYIRLRLDSIGHDAEALKRATDTACSGLTRLIGSNLVAVGDLTPAQILLNEAAECGATIATAESCTGGNIAAAITAIPGSSASMLGGIVAYSNDVKMRLLGVSADTLATKGAVSEEVAAQMALGACKATGADIAMATSGIAGPGGGTPAKPVGTVCIAVACRGKVAATTMHFPGNRTRIVQRAVSHALIMAISMLREQKNLYKFGK